MENSFSNNMCTTVLLAAFLTEPSLTEAPKIEHPEQLEHPGHRP